MTGRVRGITRQLGTVGCVAAAFLILLVIIAVVAPWAAPYGPTEGSILDAYLPMSGSHLLGTDANGFDVFSRLLDGARTSLLGPAGVIVLSLVVGVPPALAAAWSGGWVDAVVSRIADVLFALPGILLAVLAVAIFGPGLTPAILSIAISYLPYVARVVRSAALQQRKQPYITALEVQGASAFTISFRHVLPNISGVVLAQSMLAFGYALSDLAALSFLGLAVQAPQADWGVLVNDASGMRNGHSVQVMAASVLIVTTIVALTTIGDRLAGEAPVIRRRLLLPRRTPKVKTA